MMDRISNDFHFEFHFEFPFETSPPLSRLPCSFVSNSLLGSYACQSQLGDWDPAEHGQSIDYIKSIKFCPGQSDELIEKIAELHRTNQLVLDALLQTILWLSVALVDCRGMMADEAEYNYLENAKHMALYGVHQIPAKVFMS